MQKAMQKIKSQEENVSKVLEKVNLERQLKKEKKKQKKIDQEDNLKRVQRQQEYQKQKLLERSQAKFKKVISTDRSFIERIISKKK